RPSPSSAGRCGAAARPSGPTPGERDDDVSTAAPETSRLRLAVVGVIVLSLFAALFSRLWYLQVMDAPTLQVRADQNRIRIVHEEAPRGRILDRRGRPLVEN